MSTRGGLRTIAIFEATKGFLVLAVGWGALELLGRDVQATAEEIVRQFHLNPSSHYPRFLIHAAQHTTPAHLWALAAGAIAYALVRFVEAYGLWRQRIWAEWVAVIGGSIYVPWELWELARGVTWPRLVLLAINACIVGYLVRTLYQNRRRRPAAAAGRVPSL